MGQNCVPPQTRSERMASEANTSTVKELAAQEGISRATYYRRLKAANQPGKRAQVGRPRKTTVAQRKALKAKAQRSGGGTRKLAAWAAQRGFERVSRQTVAAVLKGGSSPLAYKPVKSGRVLSEKNRLGRLKFIKKNLKRNFDHVVFIDQKELSMGYDESEGYSSRWQEQGSKKVFKTSTRPQKLMFYGAVAKGHKSSLVKVPLVGKGNGRGTAGFNSAMFVDVFRQLWEQVKEWYPPGQKFWVIMDRAKQHTSNYTKCELAAMGVPLLEGFPPQSYDLNLIEVAWGHLQQQLQGESFKKKSMYENQVMEAWSKVQQSTINKLVANHTQQLKKISKANGNWVDY